MRKPRPVKHGPIRANEQAPAPAVRWDIYIVRAKGVLLGTVDAPDEAAAIEAACRSNSGTYPKRLIAVRRP